MNFAHPPLSQDGHRRNGLEPPQDNAVLGFGRPKVGLPVRKAQH
jgi:hypothetical protein